jgi:aryl-alcohol dehydrogenase-like predicted oxidoreductase
MPSIVFSRLTFGTATLGMAYGRTNPANALSAEAASALLDAAWAAGITSFDTAHAYGDAEARLGAWEKTTGHRAALVGKAPALEGGIGLEAALDESLAALGRARIDGYLLHRAADWSRPAARDALAAAKAAGRIGAAGLSLYDAEDGLSAIAAGGVDLLQVPLNALDQRAATSGLLEAAAAAGVAVMARSVFLQGLLLADPDRLEPALAALAPALRSLRAVAAEAGMPLPALLLRAVTGAPGVSTTIVGAYTPGQLAETAAGDGPPLDPAIAARLQKIAAAVPPSLLDPRRWPR